MPVTDLDTLKALLQKAGIVFHEGDAKVRQSEFYTKRGAYIATTILVPDCGTVQNCGYTGFYTEFFFDKDGKLLGMGAWE